MNTIAEDVRQTAVRARAAAATLAPLSRADKDRALYAMADAILAAGQPVLQANAEDVAMARDAGTGTAMVDRLTLTTDRLVAIAGGLRKVAALDDPVGEVVRGRRLPNGIELRQVRVPLGVVGIIYEARPNVTVDAAGLCLKSGNAVLLRGSASAARTNAALVAVLREAAAGAGLPADAVALVPGADHESVKQLMRLRGLVDVLIPRGGAGLIRAVVAESTVPVIETGVGNCHVYVDVDADLDQALAIVLNAKTQRVSVCNAAETLLVHAGVADAFLPRVLTALRQAGVTIHGDDAVRAHDPSALPATEQDWATEYLSLDMAVRVVGSLAEAVAHIRQWGSGHTEAIITRSLEASRRFVATCDSAAVMVNASTRFTDGERFGFGAEIGISTQKLHARGPMGPSELTSTTWVGVGDGHLVI
ncbi:MULTISPECIES: glutamate-5-semialdehyde dehydrogenase [unclassified Frankia]|uniref:glutamate-5-semialdehyde dehydrogenase n=1 Tax=unclassified Frankia TaxID=2632575 RepID=UPI001EF4A1D5|nr:MULTISPECIES: glutamate-5-semialdehyde dehydrogenase [unclassified Frankia]